MEKSLQTIIIGADHRGFRLKEELKRTFSEWGYLLRDAGAMAYDADDDYPDFAAAVARAVSADEKARGIIACGSGVGMAVAANKVAGARAALCFNSEQAAASRHDDDANILVLAADYLTAQQARRIAKVWLETAFAKKERYMRRLKKIEDIERQNSPHYHRKPRP